MYGRQGGQLATKTVSATSETFCVLKVTNNTIYRQENELRYCSFTVLYSCFIQVKEFKYNLAFSDMYRYRFALIRASHSSKKLLTRSENAPALLIHEGNALVGM